MTKKKAQIGYEFLDASGNFIYEARETGKTHTPFASEILLFQSIKCGDLTGVKNALNLYRQSGLIIGHMSDQSFPENTLLGSIHHCRSDSLCYSGRIG